MLKIDQIVKVRGMKVRIIDIDSDPRCWVFGVRVDDPDRRVNFMRNEVEAA